MTRSPHVPLSLPQLHIALVSSVPLLFHWPDLSGPSGDRVVLQRFKQTSTCAPLRERRCHPTPPYRRPFVDQIASQQCKASANPRFRQERSSTISRREGVQGVERRRCRRHPTRSTEGPLYLQCPSTLQGPASLNSGSSKPITGTGGGRRAAAAADSPPSWRGRGQYSCSWRGLSRP